MTETKPKLSDEVAVALACGKPVVALETSIIAQGLPHPANLQTARRMAEAIRNRGAVPCWTAVLDGQIRCGLDEPELERLAEGPQVRKVAAGQLGLAKSAGVPAATTVSATLAIAASAGITVAATGGIGGVLRGRHFDISADLFELARRAVALVSAGPKAMMDGERTYELLETLGVPVVAFRCSELPLFFSAQSGLECRWRLDEVPSLARAVRESLSTLPDRGVLIVQAPPADYALELEQLRALTDKAHEALNDAVNRGIKGPELTPLLLERLHALSGGRTLRLNQELAVRNVELAAALAVAILAPTQT